MELAGDEPGMLWDLHDLYQSTIDRAAGNLHPSGHNTVLVTVVELVAVAVPFNDHVLDI